MVKLIANRSMKYGRTRVPSGGVFEAKPKDAKLLVAIHKADYYVAPVKVWVAPKVEAFVEDEPVVPEILAEEPAEEPVKAKRTYKRRDMQSEE